MAWRLAPLGTLGTWRGGGTPSKANGAFWGGGVPWVSPKDMKSSVVHRTEDTITEAALSGSAAKLVPLGSVLVVTRSGILERTLPVAVNAVPVTLNQDMKALTPDEGVDATFVYWALRAFEREILRTCSKAGTTVASIETTRLCEFSIPLPPLDEQLRIVAALEEHLSDLDAAVAGVERALARLKQLAAATRAATVDGSVLGRHASRSTGPDPWSPAVPAHWEWSDVDSLSQDICYGTSAKTGDAVSGVPVLRMGNIVDGSLDWTSLKYLPHEHHEFPDLLLNEGDLLFNRTNSPELVGKSAVFRGERTPASFASYLLRVRLGERMLPEFLAAYINSSYGRAWVASCVSQQVGQANVNGTKLKGLRVPVPPIEEQRELVEHLRQQTERGERLANDLGRQLRRGHQLRRALLAEAFAGRLVRAADRSPELPMPAVTSGRTGSRPRPRATARR